MQFLSSLDLPGNVRQLENLCNWITVMAPGQTVEIKDLPQDLTEGQGFALAPSSPAPTMSNMPQQYAAAAPSDGPQSVELPRNVAGSPPLFGAPMTVNGANGAAERTNWIALLETEAAQMLSAGKPEVMDALGRQFELTLIKLPGTEAYTMPEE